MKKIFTILILSSLFAGELQVDGNLTVTGDINSPSIDALSGMKLDRIYRYEHDANTPFSFTVPENKVWLIAASGHEIIFYLNDKFILIQPFRGQSFVLALAGDVITHENETSDYFLNIYEYSISGSGTDQGMDYIVP